MKQAQIVLTSLDFSDLVEGRVIFKDVGTPPRAEVLRVFIVLEDIGLLQMMHAVVLASKNAERRRVESSR